jgi:hypothetical protein
MAGGRVAWRRKFTVERSASNPPPLVAFSLLICNAQVRGGRLAGRAPRANGGAPVPQMLSSSSSSLASWQGGARRAAQDLLLRHRPSGNLLDFSGRSVHSPHATAVPSNPTAVLLNGIATDRHAPHRRLRGRRLLTRLLPAP